MTTDGGPELINQLSLNYYGEPFTGDEGTDQHRSGAREDREQDRDGDREALVAHKPRHKHSREARGVTDAEIELPGDEY